MYNRYVPQPDGSYRRNRVPDKSRPQVTPKPPQPPVPPCSAPEPPVKSEAPKPNHRPPVNQDSSVTGFLRQLLPKNFDTGDLIVVLLLLLMAGDREEDRNNALLTLALYFFM